MIDDRGRVARRLAALIFLALWQWPSAAEAQLEGRYETQGQRVSVKVDNWGDDCGSRPRSYSARGGKVVAVRRIGPHLRLGSQRTDRCWSRNPKVQRRRAAVGANRWHVVCETPASDPRFEHGEYTLERVNETTLRLREESRYNWRLEGDHCTAVVVLTRTYRRLPDEEPSSGEPAEPPPENPPPVAPPPEPPVEARCEGPAGLPVKIDLRPTLAKVGPGDRVCFRAMGRDNRGCPAPLEVQWSKARRGTTVRGGGGRLSSDGCYTAGTSPVDSEGRVVIVASAGDLTARAKVVVGFPDISDLIAASLEEGLESPDAGLAESTAEARPGAVQGVGRSGASPSGEPSGLLWALIGIAGIAAALLLLAVMIVMRRRKAHAAAEEEAESASSGSTKARFSVSPAGVGLVCPTCDREFETGRSYCPDDATKLVPKEAGEQADLAHEALICPKCRRGYDGVARFCPHDSEKLVPYSEFRKSKLEAREARAREQMVCPRCSARYDAGTLFCEKDGAKLEPVN